MILRQAQIGDAPDIVRIMNRVIADTLITFTTVQRHPDDIAADIAARGPGYQVLEVAGSVAGLATYGPFRAGPGYAATCEHSIQLDPEIRGQGAGRRLMERLIEVARDEGLHVMVAAVSGANPGGVAFHRAMGFAEAGRMTEVGRKQGQWLDLILMQKTLSPH